DQVRVILRAYRHVPYNKDDDFDMMTAASIMKVLNETTKYIRFGLVGISSISLVVGGIIIMNIMMVSVTERTREIGIRKSIGARQKDILFQFLFESIMVSLGGGIIGIVLGSVIADILIGLMNMNMTPSMYAIGLGLGISVGTGLFFGIYPAMKAARLQPVKALSFE
ncbi:MAG: FtsX-like permease family protein, partial [Candidatus Zixiibacteriota bacterium]